MDDLLVSTSTVADGKRICKEVNGCLQEGGIELTKWISNNQEVLEHSHRTGVVELKGNSAVTVLGLTWIPATDMLRFRVNLAKRNTSPTKRTIASEVAKIFDPNGYISPITTKAKIFLQDLLREGIPHWPRRPLRGGTNTTLK